MAKYIEFVGVPGVGKSTTYEFLKRKYVENSNWIPYEELCKSKNEPRKGIKEIVISYLITKIKPNALSKISHDRVFLNKAIENNPELIELFWKSISKVENINGEELRFYGVNYIRSILEKIERVKEKNSPKYGIVDEGLIHNLKYFITPIPDQEFTVQVSNILRLIYLPQAVIYFTGDPEIIVKRTLERGNLRIRDKSLTHQELINSKRETLKEKEVYLEVVRSKNIPILSLDAKDSVEVKSSSIISFLNELP